ncbi:aldose epimerase family protein [Devosia faecipullorum]|uniref:hypothetical protein n=1 Tax=Devosia faecipullorum TaxID=2755039 RepID=UPI00187BB101|nr:hypothetical protein [Devosia faecipullorum]MBE7731567.1 hypothetical protein [Devosia faecipullorum]
MGLAISDGEHSAELGGTANDREAFSHAVEFAPSLRFFEQRAEVECTISVENVGGDHMPCMYLGHVNFAPGSGAVPIDTATGATYTLTKPPQPSTTPQSAHDWHERACADFSQHRQVGMYEWVEPEIVKTLTLPAGADGCPWRAPGRSAHV